MTTFVLVHGAWHGGWCWRRVAGPLREAGHTVHTPSLTGLGERAHLIGPAVGLDTHIEDIARLILVEDLREVVLVGHSYAGQVITGVADRLPDRIALRIHLDAFVPGDGDRARDLLPEDVAHHWAESVAERGFGWLVPPRSLEVLGVTDPADLAWLEPLLTPHPWLTYTQPLRLTGAADRVPAAYLGCTAWKDVFAGQRGKAERLGWPVLTIGTGHEAMVTAPDETVSALLKLAAEAASG
ncbi:alpha/beta fold hydrolase [Actinomadura sp. SCN-SB]|uniref:alpha/beta fold hydrolase n=1 Tax=Actinomadura sp. SCN-SB TaxID=3373092 RepID=UPI003750CB32